MLVGGVKVGERRKTGEKEGMKDEKKKKNEKLTEQTPRFPIPGPVRRANT